MEKDKIVSLERPSENLQHMLDILKQGLRGLIAIEEKKVEGAKKTLLALKERKELSDKILKGENEKK